MSTEAPLTRVRETCLALPGVTERLSHGQPAWFVADKKQFAVYLERHHGDDRPRLWSAAPAGAQASLVDADPARYFRPPYVGTRGWLGTYLHEPLDWAVVAGLLEEAYRAVAPRRWLAELETRQAPAPRQDAGQT